MPLHGWTLKYHLLWPQALAEHRSGSGRAGGGSPPGRARAEGEEDLMKSSPGSVYVVTMIKWLEPVAATIMR
jgi:hypothetical protein